MVISWSTLCATDHARSSGTIVGSSTCDNVGWPMGLCESALMIRWAVEVSSPIRYPYDGFSIKIKDGGIKRSFVGRIQ